MRELSHDELQNINGGFVWWVVGGVVVAGCAGVGFYNGYKDEKED